MTHSSRKSPAKYRPDIDGLRAIAIIAVVFYHAGFPGFGGGFVGVDVFFVIFEKRAVAGAGASELAAFNKNQAQAEHEKSSQNKKHRSDQYGQHNSLFFFKIILKNNPKDTQQSEKRKVHPAKSQAGRHMPGMLKIAKLFVWFITGCAIP